MSLLFKSFCMLYCFHCVGGWFHFHSSKLPLGLQFWKLTVIFLFFPLFSKRSLFKNFGEIIVNSFNVNILFTVRGCTSAWDGTCNFEFSILHLTILWLLPTFTVVDLHFSSCPACLWGSSPFNFVTPKTFCLHFQCPFYLIVKKCIYNFRQ